MVWFYIAECGSPIILKGFKESISVTGKSTVTNN